MTKTAREKSAEYRLNTRLDAKRARKLKALARATGASVSDVNANSCTGIDTLTR